MLESGDCPAAGASLVIVCETCVPPNAKKRNIKVPMNSAPAAITSFGQKVIAVELDDSILSDSVSVHTF